MSAESGQNLSSSEYRILDIIQSHFPLESRPYAAVGRALGLTEAEVLAYVRALKGKGIIRRLGPNFQSSTLGFRSTLCAAKVPPEKLDAFIAEVNACPGVTHNYLRKHEYNVWFTLIGPSWEAVCETLNAVSEKTGIAILNLPAEKLYKIRVDFPMNEADA
jgi:DNA-binding Lrp family transcriptional regulator